MFEIGEKVVRTKYPKADKWNSFMEYKGVNYPFYTVSARYEDKITLRETGGQKWYASNYGKVSPTKPFSEYM